MTMGEAERKERAMRRVQAVLEQCVNEGRLIEGGFRSLLTMSYDNPEEIAPEQLNEMRSLFFAGAHYLWHHAVATDSESIAVQKMTLIKNELGVFLEDAKRKHSGPPPKPRGTVQ